MATSRETERLHQQLSDALQATGRLSTSLESLDEDVKEQIGVIRALRHELDALRNGDEEHPGILTRHALLEQKVAALWAIVIVGGGALLLALATSAVFWKSLIRAAGSGE